MDCLKMPMKNPRKEKGLVSSNDKICFVFWLSGIPSPAGNQNAAAAAAAAAVLAAINTANSHSSPQSTGDLPNVPSRPPSIHTKDQGSRSPATSSGDHKSESGGSGVNDLGAATSPSKSLNQSNAQMSGAQSAKFSSDVATGM